ncbi:hypothetical protein POX_a00853 [Penicillium oxalicum]|uniref:hypothetical protein n=1 Tax=Penicillium oxalicum TaxID=69781 RepID=UPI0020B6C825|nr:hypothetical protein POX_a00853 [Penicillium oxalicum]KAI2794261.1 hypothetical protein POX_a00853 [Penicillium oxalicum]
MRINRGTWARLVTVSLLGAADLACSVHLSKESQALLDQSMSILDDIYDVDAGYVNWFYYPLAAGAHETRSSVWYAVGLLQRNQDDDRDEAIRILTNVIGGQERNTSVLWYGDYTVYPEQPTVGSPAYAPDIYNTYDPNWRGFIGTALILIYEEFGHLLPTGVKQLVVDSLYNNTVGDSYRVGGVDNDNLYPAYSNAWLMRTITTAWTGHQVQDANMTAAANADAQSFLDLFDGNHTLSEFNGPTYAGVSLYALTIAAKYLPSNSSLIGHHAARLVQDIWETESQLWNPNMRNLAGPWDRSYGYDMNRYVAIMSLWVWSLVGKEHAWRSKTPIWTMAHADDFEISPLVAILSGFQRTLLPETVLKRLTAFTGERTYTGHAFAPPADYEPRNISTWISANLTIGTASFNQSVLGGYSKDSSSFSPSVVQWTRPAGSIGYFNLYPTETALRAEVSPYALNLTYPNGNDTSRFTFALAVNPLGGKRDVSGLEDVDGLKIDVVGGSVNPVPEISFCGLVGGTCNVIQ